MRIVATLAFAAALLATPANAKIMFEIEDAVVVPGQVGRFGVFVTGTEYEPLEAFNLPIDIGGDGRGFPAGISFAGNDIASDDFAQEIDTFSDIVITGTGTLPMTPPFDPRFEAVFSDNGSTIDLTPDRLRLFNVLLDIPLGFVGPIVISMSDSGFPDPFTVVSGSSVYKQAVPGVLVLVSGSIYVVPEPGVIPAISALVFAFGYRRGKRMTSSRA